MAIDNSVVKHVVSSTDTIEGIAFRYRGNTDDWQIIVDYNGLDEPYITNDANFMPQIPATGLVLFTRSAGAGAALTIPAGTTVGVPADKGVSLQKLYTVLTDTTIPAGQTSVLALVQCTYAGDWGNVVSGEIRMVIAMQMISTPSAVLALSVTNPTPITNGGVLNVKTPGDVLLVPTAQGTFGSLSTTVTSEEDYLALIGGTDIALTPDGDFMIDIYGDWDTFTGMDNMEDAAKTRVGTEYGELPLHPGYGCGARAAIGEPNQSIRSLLVGLEIRRSLIQDDRFTDVQVQNLQIQNNQVRVNPVITVAGGAPKALGTVTF